MIKGVLFDLDGVLFDGAPIHFQALNLALANHGLQPIGTAEHKHVFDGLPTREKLRRLVETGVITPEQVPAIEKSKQEITRRLMAYTIEFNPTAYCLLSGLTSYGYKVGVVTNSVTPTAVLVLDLLQLPAVNVLVTNQDAEPKPSPAPYTLACQRLGLSPQEVVVFEDGKYGIESAQAAGCTVVRVLAPSSLTPAFVWRHLC